MLTLAIRSPAIAGTMGIGPGYHRGMSKIRPSRKASSFTESVIREMTRLSVAHGAINLSQGFPDFPAPEEVKEAARAAIAADINQYPITWGAEGFRAAIAETTGRATG